MVLDSRLQTRNNSSSICKGSSPVMSYLVVSQVTSGLVLMRSPESVKRYSPGIILFFAKLPLPLIVDCLISVLLVLATSLVELCTYHSFFTGSFHESSGLIFI